MDTIKLIYKTKTDLRKAEKVNCSDDAHNALKGCFDPETIELYEKGLVLFLNRENRVLGTMNIGEGGVAGTVFDLRRVATAALLSNASGVIFAHNHPSGNLKPSQADITLTRSARKV